MFNNHSSSSKIRVAIQKSGRLAEKSSKLLFDCGIEFSLAKNHLLSESTNFPLELMLVRDDDIPEYVRTGVCDLGLVGLNALKEHEIPIDSNEHPTSIYPIIQRYLGFGKCRLSLAIPQSSSYQSIQDLEGKKIATSYPHILSQFLKSKNIKAQLIEITGSVELTPMLGVSDFICDLVSTGSTLRSHNLKEVETLLESECVLIQTPQKLTPEKQLTISRILQRIDGVQKASKNKYVMMNAPRSALPKIHRLLPGMDHPSIMNLDGSDDMVAIHAVCQENIFWDTMEKLKAVGAQSILVVPIEKIL